MKIFHNKRVRPDCHQSHGLNERVFVLLRIKRSTLLTWLHLEFFKHLDCTVLLIVNQCFSAQEYAYCKCKCCRRTWSLYAPGTNLVFTFSKSNLFYFSKIPPNLFIIISIAYKHNILVLVN